MWLKFRHEPEGTVTQVPASNAHDRQAVDVTEASKLWGVFVWASLSKRLIVPFLALQIMLYGYPVERLCTYQYSLISLMPGKSASREVVPEYRSKETY